MIKTLGVYASEISLGAAQNALFLGLGVVSELGVVCEAEQGRGATPIGGGAPRCMPSGASLSSRPSDLVQAGPEFGGATVVAHVLVCDDETRLGDLTAGLLEECGFGAGFVPSAVDAMAYLEAHRDTQVLLLDVNLSGGKSAQDLLAFLVDKATPLRVVLTSGSARQEVRTELTQHPLVVGYLEKPYAEEELTAAITNALCGD